MNFENLELDFVGNVFTRNFVLSLKIPTISKLIASGENMICNAMDIADNLDDMDIVEQMQFSEIHNDIQRMKFNLGMLIKALSHKEKFVVFEFEKKPMFVHFN